MCPMGLQRDRRTAAMRVPEPRPCLEMASYA